MKKIYSPHEYERRRIVIEFIMAHPGCLAQDIIRGQNVNCREKVFKILRELKCDRIVVEKRTKDNKKNKKLFIYLDNCLVSIPRDIDEFEKLYFNFVEKVLNRISNTILVLNRSLAISFEEYKRKLKKKHNEKLTSAEIVNIMQDVDVSTDFEELSIYTSFIIKAIDLFNEFVRLCTVQSTTKWSIEMNDRKSLSKLLSLVFNKISNMQIEMIEKLSPALKTLYGSHTLPMLRSETQVDLQEILRYYEYLGLEAEVTPLINCLSKISNNIKNPDLRLPLKECGIISPSEVSAETMREFFRPEEYDLDLLQESIEGFPGELEGVEMEQIRELLFDKDELTVNP